ncbi:MAG: ChbG/HpnK family deacetylase [Acidobacteria bacterium]|nr:ChbG/HpnK family deacetylase [Acidobacteriota bacterium]
MPKYLIVNADDFGASSGVNRGILECHTGGLLTSASLMVTGRAAADAAAIARDHPALSVGLHWDVWGEDERTFDISNLDGVRDEFALQLDRFIAMVGRMPTHVDSHRHVHRAPHLRPVFRELVAPLGVPLRRDSAARFIGSFYAQWEWMATNLEYVGVPFLQRLLQDEVREGWNELACHPGYVSPDFRSVYLAEREAEVKTLTDPRIRQTIDELGIQLASFAELATRPPHSAGGRL